MPTRLRCSVAVLTLILGCTAPADEGGSTDGGSSSGGSEGGPSSGGASTTADTQATGGVDGSGGDGTSAAASSGGDAASTGASDSSGGPDGGSSTGGEVCVDVLPAIVTDIDATLTTSDNEFLLQLADGNYDPAERDGAAEMINAYADLGYRVMYLTARSETLVSITTLENARELTERWLMEHGFPLDPDTTVVVLSPNLVVGPATATYKTEQIAALQDEGWRFDYAYGNADTDITGYADAGIALDETFIIGPQGGMGGTVAIPEDDWVAHTAEQIPLVPAVCEAM